MHQKSVRALVALLLFIPLTASSCPSDLDRQDTEQNLQNWEYLQDGVEEGTIKTTDPDEQLSFEARVETSTDLARAMDDAAQASDGEEEEAEGDAEEAPEEDADDGE